MPIKKAAAKALRQAKKRTLRNQKVKEGIEYLRRMTRKALESDTVKEAEALAKSTIRAIDRAVQKKVLKKNTGSRLKSRLTKTINAALAKAKKK